jgi:methylated-DNA-protein-cysteine methyltransferase related protein
MSSPTRSEHRILPPSTMSQPAHPPGSVYRRIYIVVAQVPPGRVATYGQIAGIVGRCTPRLVGYAMAGLPSGSDVPWHRIVNARGRISPRGSGDGSFRQRQLLEAEGIQFDPQDRIDLDEFGWTGPDWDWLAHEGLL